LHPIHAASSILGDVPGTSHSYLPFRTEIAAKCVRKTAKHLFRTVNPAKSVRNKRGSWVAGDMDQPLAAMAASAAMPKRQGLKVEASGNEKALSTAESFFKGNYIRVVQRTLWSVAL